MQLAARQRRLQHVGGVHRAFRLAGADQRMQLVDEQDDVAGGGGDLLQHRLQPLLELAAILGAGDQRAEIQRHQRLVLAGLPARRHWRCAGPGLRRWRSCRRRARRSARDCSWCGAPAPGWCGGFPRRGRSPDRACPRAPAPSGRGHISSARHSCLRRFALCAVRPLRTSLIAALRPCAVAPASLRMSAGGAVAGQRQREQQALGGDEAVAGLLRQFFRLVQHARQFGRHVDLAGAGAFDLRLLVERRSRWRARARAGSAPAARSRSGGQAFLVVQQNFQKMLGSQPLMARSAGPGSAQPAGSRATAR